MTMMRRLLPALCATLWLAPAWAACPGGWTTVSAASQLVITTTGSLQSWTVPATWSTTNSIEVIGAGGAGDDGGGCSNGDDSEYRILSNTAAVAANATA